MNEIFSARRYRMLMVKTILERPGQLLGATILSFSAVLLVYFFIKSVSNIGTAQFISFAVGLIGGGCLFCSIVFGYFSDGARGASYLTLPASIFEKWLCAIVLILLHIALFLSWFRAIDDLFVHLYHSSLNRNDPRYAGFYNAVYLFSFTSSDAQGLYAFFANSAGPMLIGSLYFNKIPFIKTALFICGLYFFTFLLNYLIGIALFPDAMHFYPFHMLAMKAGDDFKQVVMPPWFYPLWDVITLYLLPAIFCIISYIRLKEKEI
jgi:hypothetical protein